MRRRLVYYSAMKREFRVYIKRVETCEVVVSAEDESTAKDVALDQESMGMVDGYVYDSEQVVVEPLL